MPDGSLTSQLAISAGGKTKAVVVVDAMKVETIDRLVAAVRALSEIRSHICLMVSMVVQNAAFPLAGAVLIASS